MAQSKTLQNLIDKGLSDCFFKASIWQQDATTDTAQMDSIMKQQRNEILRRASTEDSQEVCLMFDTCNVMGNHWY